jgi:hypothetical protein
MLFERSQKVKGAGHWLLASGVGVVLVLGRKDASEQDEGKMGVSGRESPFVA